MYIYICINVYVFIGNQVFHIRWIIFMNAKHFVTWKYYFNYAFLWEIVSVVKRFYAVKCFIANIRRVSIRTSFYSDCYYHRLSLALFQRFFWGQEAGTILAELTRRELFFPQGGRVRVKGGGSGWAHPKSRPDYLKIRLSYFSIPTQLPLSINYYFSQKKYCLF